MDKTSNFLFGKHKKNALKVMAFGGCITTLPLDENQEYFFDDEKKYEKICQASVTFSKGK